MAARHGNRCMFGRRMTCIEQRRAGWPMQTAPQSARFSCNPTPAHHRHNQPPMSALAWRAHQLGVADCPRDRLRAMYGRNDQSAVLQRRHPGSWCQLTSAVSQGGGRSGACHGEAPRAGSRGNPRARRSRHGSPSSSAAARQRRYGSQTPLLPAPCWRSWCLRTHRLDRSRPQPKHWSRFAFRCQRTGWAATGWAAKTTL